MLVSFQCDRDVRDKLSMLTPDAIGDLFMNEFSQELPYLVYHELRSVLIDDNNELITISPEKVSLCNQSEHVSLCNQYVNQGKALRDLDKVELKIVLQNAGLSWWKR